VIAFSFLRKEIKRAVAQFASKLEQARYLEVLSITRIVTICKNAL
jgi:hypothetical protein